MRRANGLSSSSAPTAGTHSSFTPAAATYDAECNDVLSSLMEESGQTRKEIKPIAPAPASAPVPADFLSLTDNPFESDFFIADTTGDDFFG